MNCPICGECSCECSRDDLLDHYINRVVELRSGTARGSLNAPQMYERIVELECILNEIQEALKPYSVEGDAFVSTIKSLLRDRKNYLESSSKYIRQLNETERERDRIKNNLNELISGFETLKDKYGD